MHFFVARLPSITVIMIVDFGTNWKCLCEFLLVINSNFCPVFHFLRYGDLLADTCQFYLHHSHLMPLLVNLWLCLWIKYRVPVTSYKTSNQLRRFITDYQNPPTLCCHGHSIAPEAAFNFNSVLLHLSHAQTHTWACELALGNGGMWRLKVIRVMLPE